MWIVHIRTIILLYCPEHRRKFETDRSVAEIKQPATTEKNWLELIIDGVTDTNWFRLKHKEFLEEKTIIPPFQKKAK